jgi:hypothetical protein
MMMAKELADFPNGLLRIYRRFEHWRNKHAGSRLPIPVRLWSAAAKAAREHGVCRTAQVLRLEYGKLKRLAESGDAEARIGAKKVRRAESDAPPSFLELVGWPGKLCVANPFDYLNQLQRHSTDMIRNPAQWMPWNYQATLAQSGLGLDSG